MKRRSDSYKVDPFAGDVSKMENPSLTSFNGSIGKSKEGLMDSPTESTTSLASVSEAKDRHNKHGVHWIICSVMLVGEMAGGGLVALPESMVDAGIYAGIVLTIVSALATGYTGVQLGNNWIMMQKRWPEYLKECKKPYPEMAYRAIGRGGRIFVSIIISVQQFMLVIVFLLLASNNISSFIHAFWNYNFNFCYIALIVAVVLLPFLMLESPKDFWQAGVVAMVSTSCAIVLIFIGAAHDQEQCMKEVYYPPVQFEKFFLSYGTIMFAYGGHSVFPTIQHDMKHPEQFGRSVILGYIAILIMYLPVSVYGYVVYGGSLTGSVITSLQLAWVQDAVNILITIHAMFTQVIVISPLSLQVESLVGIPNKFGPGRIISRTLILVAAVIVGMTIPKFGPLLDLVGGSTISLMTVLLPGIFNMFLVAGKRTRDEKVAAGLVSEAEPDEEWASIKDVFKYNNNWILAINLVILVIGLIGGIASTVSAVIELTTYSFNTPCYIQVFQGTSPPSAGLVQCCGKNLDVVTIPGKNYTTFCSAFG